MNTWHNKPASHTRLVDSGYVDPALQATMARDLIWGTLQDACSREPVETVTLESLRKSVTLAVTTSLGLSKYELVRLLKQYGTH
jgi:hypothetical protein